MSKFLWHDECMTFVVAIRENIKRLIAVKADGNQSEASRHSKVPQRTIGRVMNGDVAPTVDTVYKLATAYGYEAWQLLVPGFDPDKPPKIAIANGIEQQLIDKLRVVAEEVVAYKSAKPHQ